MSKGHRQRPTNVNKYGRGYDEIFRNSGRREPLPDVPDTTNGIHSEERHSVSGGERDKVHIPTP